MRGAGEAGILCGMRPAHLYQILPPQVAREELDAGFEVLDNTANERPDWFEYWPIRRYLSSTPLDDSAYYGFFSPKFERKTNLSAAAVRDFIAADASSPDAMLFSPSIHNSAYYWNVFEHGDAEHPGLKRIAQRVFDRLGVAADLDGLITDSRNTVYSNFFAAKPRFWRAWLELNERLFVLAETAGDELGEALRAPTDYRGERGVQMKVFIMERMASWLLAADARFTAKARDPFAARSRIYKLPLAVACDALKIAYATQGRAQYRDVFLWARGCRRLLNAQVRVGGALGLPGAAAGLRQLRSYWREARR
jgi:hypothetical protein